MANYEELNSIINRILSAEYTDVDIAALRKLLDSADNQVTLQLGKYNVNFAEGKEIHIGDAIYNQWDEKALSGHESVGIMPQAGAACS